MKVAKRRETLLECPAQKGRREEGKRLANENASKILCFIKVCSLIPRGKFGFKIVWIVLLN
jgi:hypothetical protein